MMFCAGEENVLGSENPHGSSVFRQQLYQVDQQAHSLRPLRGFIFFFSSEEAAVPDG